MSSSRPPLACFCLVGLFAHFCAVRHDRSGRGLVDWNLAICEHIRVWPDYRQPDSADTLLIWLLASLAGTWTFDISTSTYLNCITCSMGLFSTTSLHLSGSFAIVMHLVLLVEVFILHWWFAWTNWKSCLWFDDYYCIINVTHHTNLFVAHFISEIHKCYSLYNFVQQKIT